MPDERQDIIDDLNRLIVALQYKREVVIATIDTQLEQLENYLAEMESGAEIIIPGGDDTTMH